MSFMMFKTPGPVEYISGLEIEHGSKVLGRLKRHISLEVVTYLVQTGADIHATGDRDNRTILHHAAADEGHLDVVKYLISLGAHVNVGDNRGWTPLHMAAFFGHLSIVQFLVQSGADTNIRDKWGLTALDWARQWDNPEVAAWLQNHTT
jgi:ankyrin repeat protein